MVSAQNATFVVQDGEATSATGRDLQRAPE